MQLKGKIGDLSTFLGPNFYFQLESHFLQFRYRPTHGEKKKALFAFCVSFCEKRKQPTVRPITLQSGPK